MDGLTRVIRASKEYQDTDALFLSKKVNGDGKGGGWMVRTFLEILGLWSMDMGRNLGRGERGREREREREVFWIVKTSEIQLFFVLDTGGKGYRLGG